MDHRPAEREEDNAMTLQIHVVKLAHGCPLRLLGLCENNLDLNFNELTASSGRNPELKSHFVAIRCDNRVAAIDNSCSGAGESAEDHACRERDADNVDQRLECNETVSGDSNGDDVSVSNRREGVAPEEKSSIKRLPA